LIYHKLEQYNITQPGKVAVICKKAKITYSQLFFQIHAISHWISVQVKSKSPIGILLPNSLNAILAFLAVPLSEKIAVPLDPSVHKRNFEIILQEGDITHIITTKKFKPLFKNHPKLICWYVEDLDQFKIVYGVEHDHVSLLNYYSPINYLSPNETAYIFFTTGSTGAPKGVMLSHTNLFTAASNIVNYMGMDDTVVESLPMPLSHSFGFARLRAVLQSGGTVIIENGLLFINKVLENIKTHNANALSMVPTGYSLMLTTYLTYFKGIAPSLKFIELGSEAMKRKFKEQLMEVCSNAIICMHYGSTEASRSTFINFKKDKDFIDSIGKPTPSVIIKLLDEKGNVITQSGELGEVVVSSDTVSKGYWKNEKLTKEKFKPDGYHMGDIAKYDKNGYLYLVGRKHDLMNINGFTVSPKEIEIVIESHPWVVEVAIIQKPDQESKTNGITAYVVTSQPVKLSELTKFCKQELESYKIPSLIIFLEKLPKTWSGEVEKYKLT